MFQGSYVALVTPFEEDTNRIDEKSLKSLIEWHAESGTDGIVVSGTTGEAPALSRTEKETLIRKTCKYAPGDLQVIAGTGSSSTEEAVQLSVFANEQGCDGVLVVCPFYNKPTQEGIYKHYKAIAEETDLPVILYDNPSRSSAEIEAETVIRLSGLEGISAIKEASGDLVHAMKIREKCDITLLSGSDPLTYPLLSIGGKGIISVVANVAPEKTARMIHTFLNGETDASRKLHESLFPLMKTLGLETNPIPVKKALSMMDRIPDSIRSPLTEASPETVKRIKESLQTLGIEQLG